MRGINNDRKKLMRQRVEAKSSHAKYDANVVFDGNDETAEERRLQRKAKKVISSK